MPAMILRGFVIVSFPAAKAIIIGANSNLNRVSHDHFEVNGLIK